MVVRHVVLPMVPRPPSLLVWFLVLFSFIITFICCEEDADPPYLFFRPSIWKVRRHGDGCCLPAVAGDGGDITGSAVSVS